MSEILKVELMDENGNTYYLKTDSESVFCTDGTSVETKLNAKINTSNIIQNSVTDDSAKIPSAAVTANLQSQINSINTDLGNFARRDQSNSFNGKQRIGAGSSDASISNTLYDNAILVVVADSTDSNGNDTGKRASIGLHNGGKEGLGLWVDGGRLHAVTNYGAATDIAWTSDVIYVQNTLNASLNALKSYSILDVAWNSQGVSEGWAVGRFYNNLGFGFIQGGFRAIETGADLILGGITAVTGSFSATDSTFPVSSSENGGVGGYGKVSSNGQLNFSLPKAGVYSFALFLQ